MRKITETELKALRKMYPAGIRVVLTKMDDPQAPPIGTCGTVSGCDDSGSIMVSWDNGSSLHVLFGEDKCNRLYDKLIEEMRPIVEKKVKHYMTDFDGSDAHSDMSVLADIMQHPSEHGTKMLWCVRECGTDIGFAERLSDKTSIISARVSGDSDDYLWYELDLKFGVVKQIDIHAYVA